MNGAADCFLCLIHQSLRTQLLLDGVNRRTHARPCALDVVANRIRLIGGITIDVWIDVWIDTDGVQILCR